MPTTQSSQRGKSGKSGLDPRELMQLRLMLEQQQGFRVEQLAALARPGSAGPLGSADDEISASLAEGARAALRDLRAALRRMTDGSYGLCTRCAGPVGRERLEILPQVAMCMPCQRGTSVEGAGVPVTPATQGLLETPVGAGRASRVGGRDRNAVRP